MNKRVNRTEVLFAIATLTLVALIALASPAFAHHPLGGATPGNGFDGLMSGLGHPILGPDHFVFVVAAGLLAMGRPKGFLIPAAFVLAALVGTGLHLMSWDLPAPETLISTSVLLFGVLLAWPKQISAAVITILASLAGIFHGYAYGESIIGAETTPLVTYLLGFTTIQFAIALGSFKLGQKLVQASTAIATNRLRFAGFTISGIGAAFLSSIALG